MNSPASVLSRYFSTTRVSGLTLRSDCDFLWKEDSESPGHSRPTLCLDEAYRLVSAPGLEPGRRWHLFLRQVSLPFLHAEVKSSSLLVLAGAKGFEPMRHYCPVGFQDRCLHRLAKLPFQCWQLPKEPAYTVPAWYAVVVAQAGCFRLLVRTYMSLAGMAGIEPANTGVKVPCLSSWRHPYIGHASFLLSKSAGGVSAGLSFWPVRRRCPSCHSTIGLYSVRLSDGSDPAVFSYRVARQPACAALCRQRPMYTSDLEPQTGIEPAQPAWKAGVLPLNYCGI